MRKSLKKVTNQKKDAQEVLYQSYSLPQSHVHITVRWLRPHWWKLRLRAREFIEVKGKW
jgi:hypothetical protein